MENPSKNLVFSIKSLRQKVVFLEKSKICSSDCEKLYKIQTEHGYCLNYFSNLLNNLYEIAQ